MKKYLIIIVGLLLLFSFGCNKKKEMEVDNNPVEVKEETKILMVYFSRADENYSVGYIEKGNTEELADFIKERANIDYSFKVERVTPYPSVYSECTDEAKKEKNNNARPDIIGDVSDFDSYDIVFLGFPIWWGTLPMPMYTFIEKHDWNGKTVIPFSTHEGSGWGDTKNTLATLLTGATFKDGFNCYGHNAKTSQNDINTWLESLGF